MQTVCDRECDAPNDNLDQTEIENRIHHEFCIAFAAWDDAPDYQKAEAACRLNQSVRRLYDFVVRGKVSQGVVTVRTASASR
jgi:hypothetical protein